MSKETPQEEAQRIKEETAYETPPQGNWEKEIYLMCPNAEVAADFVRLIRKLLQQARADVLREVLPKESYLDTVFERGRDNVIREIKNKALKNWGIKL